MTHKQLRQIQAIITFFVAFVVAIAVQKGSYALSFSGVITGMVFMIFARSKVKHQIDEREKIIREKAAQMTFAIFAPMLAIGSFILLVPYKQISPVFKHAEFAYLESVGTILAYLALFMIALYAISYHFLNKKYGGGSYEE